MHWRFPNCTCNCKLRMNHVRLPIGQTTGSFSFFFSESQITTAQNKTDVYSYIYFRAWWQTQLHIVSEDFGEPITRWNTDGLIILYPPHHAINSYFMKTHWSRKLVCCQFKLSSSFWMQVCPLVSNNAQKLLCTVKGHIFNWKKV